MADQGLLLLIRFVTSNRLTIKELKQLGDWMAVPGNRVAIDEWMHTIWRKAPEKESELTFEQLINEINEQYYLKTLRTFEFGKAVKLFQRVAAILIFPVILFFVYYTWVQRSAPAHAYTEAIVPFGQKSEIVLPDSTHVWLNSGTRLKYPAEYGKNGRNVFLEGEAYFEVVKNDHVPFIVNTSMVSVKVLGTSFNVKAYMDESDVETTLLEGKINLSIPSDTGKEYEMKPGELIRFLKSENRVVKKGFQKDEIIGWKNNRLIFRDDSFVNLVRKIERWYNVEVIYNEEHLNDQRLTVLLKEGESIDRLMEIIEKVMNVESVINNQKVYIKSKMKS